MIEFLHKGINTKLDSIEAKRVYYVNALALICLGTSVLMIVPYLLLNIHILAWVCMGFIPIYLASYLFNIKGKSTISRTILFAAITINIFVLAILLGNSINMSVFYLPLIVILFLLYDKNQRGTFLGSVILLTFISVLGYVINSLKIGSLIPFSADEIFIINTVFNGVALFGTILLTYVFVFLFEKMHVSLEDKNQTLLKERDHLYRSTIQLNKNAKEQEDLIELKTTLLSIVSHDVRQPVNSLLGISELMLTTKISEDEIQLFGSKLKESSLNVSQMLDNLLTWSYSQLNGLYPKIVSFNLKEAIEEQKHHAALSIQGKKINIELKVEENHMISFDPVMFEIVSRNILNNAIKFSPVGGTIRIYSEQKDNLTMLYICDEGIGISDELKKRIFSTDLSKSRNGTQNEKGAGIGLMLCKQLMDVNHATIDIDNSGLRGVVFVLSIPNA